MLEINSFFELNKIFIIKLCNFNHFQILKHIFYVFNKLTFILKLFFVLSTYRFSFALTIHLIFLLYILIDILDKKR